MPQLTQWLQNAVSMQQALAAPSLRPRHSAKQHGAEPAHCPEQMQQQQQTLMR
jgi:hypothetical protein